jgi:hypothetical protein
MKAKRCKLRDKIRVSVSRIFSPMLGYPGFFTAKDVKLLSTLNLPGREAKQQIIHYF